MVEPTSFQKKAIPKVKSGVNIFGIGQGSSGRTTALIINTIQKLKGKAYQDSPRALIFVKDKEAALNLELEFKSFTQHMDLRTLCVYEEAKMQNQIDLIYPGVDIVIATTKRLSKIYFQNGIHLGELQLFIVEDADFLIRAEHVVNITRINDSLGKCQHIIYASKMTPFLERLKDSLMENAQTVNV
ncbi:MAG: DEAD/DEAH box helicase [Flavobacteriales bacterium]|nr:DEAD/DEAH box helicase [Flavobacteriales bacterium]